ncbi:MAG: hypothetical protein AB2L07_11635 [Thermoanaerobaculaceae bacterium]
MAGPTSSSRSAGGPSAHCRACGSPGTHRRSRSARGTGGAQLFEHERRTWEPPLGELPGLAAEVARFHAETLARAATGAGRAALALLRRLT